MSTLPPTLSSERFARLVRTRGNENIRRQITAIKSQTDVSMFVRTKVAKEGCNMRMLLLGVRKGLVKNQPPGSWTMSNLINDPDKLEVVLVGAYSASDVAIVDKNTASVDDEKIHFKTPVLEYVGAGKGDPGNGGKIKSTKSTGKVQDISVSLGSVVLFGVFRDDCGIRNINIGRSVRVRGAFPSVQYKPDDPNRIYTKMQYASVIPIAPATESSDAVVCAGCNVVAYFKQMMDANPALYYREMEELSRDARRSSKSDSFRLLLFPLFNNSDNLTDEQVLQGPRIATDSREIRASNDPAVYFYTGQDKQTQHTIATLEQSMLAINAMGDVICIELRYKLYSSTIAEAFFFTDAQRWAKFASRHLNKMQMVLLGHLDKDNTSNDANFDKIRDRDNEVDFDNIHANNTTKAHISVQSAYVDWYSFVTTHGVCLTSNALRQLTDATTNNPKRVLIENFNTPPSNAKMPSCVTYVGNTNRKSAREIEASMDEKTLLFVVFDEALTGSIKKETHGKGTAENPIDAFPVSVLPAEFDAFPFLLDTTMLCQEIITPHEEHETTTPAAAPQESNAMEMDNASPSSSGEEYD